MNVYRLVTLITAVAAVALGRVAGATTINYDVWSNESNGYPLTDLVFYATDTSQHDVFLSPVELASSDAVQLTHTSGFEPTVAPRITEHDKDDWWAIGLFTRNAFVATAMQTRYSEVTDVLRVSDSAAAYFHRHRPFSKHRVFGSPVPDRQRYSQTTNIALTGLGLALLAMGGIAVRGPHKKQKAHDVTLRGSPWRVVRW